MGNQGNSPWANLALVFRDEINIEAFLSELFDANHDQLNNLEVLTISGSTLIGGSPNKPLHLIGLAGDKSEFKETDGIFFHEIMDFATTKDISDLMLSNEIRVGNLQIFLKGKANVHFSSLPKEICNVTTLRKLIVDSTGLKKIPPEIGKLTSLNTLNLSINPLASLPVEIGNLVNLTTLKISGRAYFDSRTHRQVYSGMLATIPKEIGLLTKLTSIDFSGNQITEIPSEIGELENLKKLNLSGNKLSRLPIELIKLTKLEQLDLRSNLLKIPPEILEGIENPHEIINYCIEISAIEIQKMFRTEQLTKPTIEDLLNTNINVATDEIYRIFKKLQFAKPLNEIKLLIVGQGSVGKTSLVHQILHGTFDQNQTKTDGISINQWQVNRSREAGIGSQRKSDSQVMSSDSRFPNPESPIKLNIWDFGGQEIMHATHQFFLTKRSLYLLVLDARLTQEENRVEYWLKIVQSFGGESPVLIVGNKTDQHPLDIDRTGLQKKYPNIVGILETSAATGAGIEALKAEIAKQVDTLPHVRDLLPETWFTVKSKLEELGRDKNFITQDEYLTMCGANDVTDETSQHTLIGFLHDLGVVLHFQDDPRLEALGILNPQWVTNGVYKILNSHELFQNQGTLTLPILNKTLIPPEYPSNKRLFMVDMMKKFELCYDIEPDKSFLIPDLLPKDEPFTGEWDGALAFQIHYNVLPSSIISRFIVRMNAFIHKTIWRSGVVLKRGENTALVKADTEDRKIYIWVGGKEDTRRDLLAMIRGEFDAIHKTIAKIEATEKVPLSEAPEADPVSLTFLQQLAIEGRDKLVVQAGTRIVELLVKEVLSQVEKEGRSSSPTTVYNIKNMYGAIGDYNTINFVQQKFEPIYEAIETSSHNATEKEDLVAEVDDIKNEVTKGEEINESFLSRRLRNLKKMAPDIAEVALATLANPAAGFAIVVQKIAKKIKEETK